MAVRWRDQRRLSRMAYADLKGYQAVESRLLEIRSRLWGWHPASGGNSDGFYLEWPLPIWQASRASKMQTPISSSLATCLAESIRIP